MSDLDEDVAGVQGPGVGDDLSAGGCGGVDVAEGQVGGGVDGDALGVGAGVANAG